MRVRPRGEQGEEGDRHEVAERRLRPVSPGGAVEPRRIDEEDDRGDHDLAEPADDEEQRREDDAPEASSGRPSARREIEDVPGDPEDERAEQDHGGERREREGEPAGDERADAKDAQHDAEDGAHRRVYGVSTATDVDSVGLTQAPR